MATLLLQTVGASIGGAVAGPIGAAVGRALGGLAGNALSGRSSKDHVIEGPRLTASRILTSSEGAAVPRAYGQVRLGGEIIWATRFKEIIRTKKTDAGGGKGSGGSSESVVNKEYMYFVNFAVGLCHGPISGIRRVWADGNELDLTRLDYRVHLGEPDQQPDPLIVAKQGLGNTPAYRDTAYIVFENFPLKIYGNRIPQISVEVLRTVDELSQQIKSINVIPGTTEFGYHPQNISKTNINGVTSAGNRRNTIARSDWTASMDELQALCPNLESVLLVVSWFGTDLRAGNCEIKPGVENNQEIETRTNWQVSGVSPDNAYQVSRIGGAPAYGGTPSDDSVLAAIADLKARGLKVVLYPFILMDIPAENDLPDPHGALEQAAYPWRGMISCFPGIGQPTSVDQTSLATQQIDQFCGQILPSDFTQSSGEVSYTGSAEYSFKRLVYHYAMIGAAAGGVDGFIIGSELRGLTTLRDEQGAFPFVDQLVNIAQDVKSILGQQTELTYAADWSEYFGYQPQDGSGDRYFHLDPLWSLPEISYVGIDNYMPLSDLRDGYPPSSDGDISVATLRANIAADEGYEWYYANALDRSTRARTAITDDQGEPWIWRFKDLVSWWSNMHHERIGGVRQANPTGWIPESKPFGFVELGCPAIDKGSNQPNVFVDPKSDQSAIPYFSNGGRDDLVQNRFLKAHISYWDPDDPLFIDAHNPVSSITGERMLSTDRISVWTWDARPFPWFPALTDIWKDGQNWVQGHWLNGRLAGCPLDSLITTVLKDFGYCDFECRVDGYVDGYLIPGGDAPRRSLGEIFSFFGIGVSEVDGKLHINSRNYADRQTIKAADLVSVEGMAVVGQSRGHSTELPREAVVVHGTVSGDYQQSASKTRRISEDSERQITMSLPLVMESSSAVPHAEARLRDMWVGQEELKIVLSHKFATLSVGDIVEIEGFEFRKWQINRIEAGEARKLDLTEVIDYTVTTSPDLEFQSMISSVDVYGAPAFELMDLPNIFQSSGSEILVYLAAFADPWRGSYAVYSSPTDDGFESRGVSNFPGVLGTLDSNLEPGPVGRWDYQNELKVSLFSDALESEVKAQVLNGANLLAVFCNDGHWELLQFQSAELQNDGSWKLTNLIRGQFGTETHMKSGSAAGNRVVALNNAITPIRMKAWESELELNWLVGPAGEDVGSENFATETYTHTDVRHKPISPAHLHGDLKPNGDLEISWVRRSRIDSDRWDLPDIPIGEASELYQVSIGQEGAGIVFETQIPNQAFLYTRQQRELEFGSVSVSLSIKVAQIGSGGRRGYSSDLSILV